jgi:hypothetical protein
MGRCDPNQEQKIMREAAWMHNTLK